MSKDGYILNYLQQVKLVLKIKKMYHTEIIQTKDAVNIF